MDNYLEKSSNLKLMVMKKLQAHHLTSKVNNWFKIWVYQKPVRKFKMKRHFETPTKTFYWNTIYLLGQCQKNNSKKYKTPKFTIFGFTNSQKNLRSKIKTPVQFEKLLTNW
jgi:hypothetical protein